MELISRVTDLDVGEDLVEVKELKTREASRGIVIRDDGKIALFLKSKKNEYKLPGGGLEGDESPEEAFKREILEETGCEVEIIKKLGVIEEYKSQSGFKQISNVFVGRVLKDTNKLSLTKKESDEGAMLFWESPEIALELIKNSFDKLIKSEYSSVYSTKFVIIRDSRILEYYLNNVQQGRFFWDIFKKLT